MSFFQNKSTLVPIVLAGLVIGMQFFATFPLQRKISQQASQLTQESVKAAIAEDQQKTALSTKAELARVEPTGKEFVTYFVNHNDVLDFITQLESAAQRAGIEQTIQDLQPPETEQQSPLRLKARGSYESLQRYLVELEHLSPYINITHAAFVQEAAPVTLSLTIQATIFWLKL